MIDLYYWPTPNGHKITMFLEEAGLDYRIIGVDITRGDQFKPDFLKIAPNNRMPAIVDHAPQDNAGPLSIFESGAILQYLAEKTGRFLPQTLREKWDVLQWLNWQMGGFGPMLGQNHHFSSYAPEKIPYAINRYIKESERLYAVLNNRLRDRNFVAENYSIADMAIYPWAVSHERQSIDLNEFPHVKNWFERIKARPATIKAYERGEEFRNKGLSMEEARNTLFNQDKGTIKDN
jgi:GST-like protein